MFDHDPFPWPYPVADTKIAVPGIARQKRASLRSCSTTTGIFPIFARRTALARQMR
jgi:hypothetical protein